MRRYKTLLRDFLMHEVRAFRQENHYSQEQMAELLRISPRSYSDLEHGKYCFSAVSLIFFFFLLTGDDVVHKIGAFHALVDKAEEDNFLS